MSPAAAQADRLEREGHFKEAAAVLKRALQAKPLAAPEQKNLEFELDRLERIKKDFPFTEDTLLDEVQSGVKYLTRPEFEQWIAEGRFDSRVIDGKRYFAAASLSNLFFRYPELSARRSPPKDQAAIDQAHWETAMAIKQAARAQGKPYVLPKRFDVTMTVTAKESAAPAGETIRAWLPIPREYPFQNGFEMISTTPPLKHLDDPQSAIRSVYLEQPAQKDGPRTSAFITTTRCMECASIRRPRKFTLSILTTPP